MCHNLINGHSLALRGFDELARSIMKYFFCFADLSVLKKVHLA